MIMNFKITMSRIRAVVMCMSIVLAFTLLYEVYTLTLHQETYVQERLLRMLYVSNLARPIVPGSTVSDTIYVNGSNVTERLYKALVNEREHLDQTVTEVETQVYHSTSHEALPSFVKQDTIQQASTKEVTDSGVIYSESPNMATSHESTTATTPQSTTTTTTETTSHESTTATTHTSHESTTATTHESSTTTTHESTTATTYESTTTYKSTSTSLTMATMQSRERVRGDRNSRIVMIPKTPLMQSQQLKPDDKDAVGTHYSEDSYNKETVSSNTLQFGSKPETRLPSNNQQVPPRKTANPNSHVPSVKSASSIKKPPYNQGSPPSRSSQNRQPTNTHHSMETNPVLQPKLDLTATPLPIPFMGDYHCRSSVCWELLSESDMPYHDYCVKKVNVRHTYSISTAQCHFMNGTHRAAVALASLPGSGNTWLRGLLEKATGICTGAIYCDVALKMAGFAGEGLRSGSVLAVKTHRAGGSWTKYNHPAMQNSLTPMYGSAILLIRNPFDALVAEWNREQGQKIKDPSQNGSHHVKYVDKEYFGENESWNYFVKTKATKWMSYFSGWVLGGLGHPLLVVRFEDLKKDAPSQMMRVLDFLKVPYSEDELRKRLMEGFGSFQRKHHEEYDHFTPRQRILVLSVIQQTLDLLRKENHNDTLGIEEYMKM